MRKFLDEINELLDDFEMELSKIRAIWKQIEIDNPTFEQVSEQNWKEKHTRMWLHGGISVQECNRLEHWLMDSRPISKTALIPAFQLYYKWRKWLETKGNFGAYYVDFGEFQIYSLLSSNVF